LINVFGINVLLTVSGCRFMVSITLLLQYGRIVDIDLKVPPRPPGYAFVEVQRYCHLPVVRIFIVAH
jgi:hypothetical protein